MTDILVIISGVVLCTVALLAAFCVVYFVGYFFEYGKLAAIKIFLRELNTTEENQVLSGIGIVEFMNQFSRMKAYNQYELLKKDNGENQNE